MLSRVPPVTSTNLGTIHKWKDCATVHHAKINYSTARLSLYESTFHYWNGSNSQLCLALPIPATGNFGRRAPSTTATRLNDLPSRLKLQNETSLIKKTRIKHVLIVDANNNLCQFLTMISIIRLAGCSHKKTFDALSSFVR